MFWTIDDDDFTATCGSRSFPLIKVGREGVLGLGKRRGITRVGKNPLVSKMTTARPTPTTITTAPTTTSASTTTTRKVNLMEETIKNIISSVGVTTDSPKTKQENTQQSDNPTGNNIIPQPSDTAGPIKITGTKREGGDTYHQSITVWIVNNILNFADKL